MKRFVLTLVCILAMLGAQGWSLGNAQTTPASYFVQLRSGACDAPGDGIAQLDDVSFADSPPVGAAGAAQAAASYSIAPVSLDMLTGSPAALFVLDPVSHAAVACGEVGGVPGADGALSIGLRPVGDSGLSGIAYLAPNAANSGETGISTFLAVTGAAPAGVGSEPTTMSAAAYSSMVSSQLTILVGSLQRIDALFADPNPGDSVWTNQVRGELFLWQLLYRVAHEVSPPPAYEEFDRRYLEALSLLDSAAADIAQALTTNDESLLSSASTKIQDAVTMLRSLDTPAEAGTPTP
ncbi:MAG: hypothetical protein KC438_04620 [Thermomicrobiales bacterium]|nr:hypothetical protein [Thermomicrobiales bacterium]MCO5223052.1 hypothetical protein [Thermomicrobiales bacterium]